MLRNVLSFFLTVYHLIWSGLLLSSVVCLIYAIELAIFNEESLEAITGFLVQMFRPALLFSLIVVLHVANTQIRYQLPIHAFGSTCLMTLELGLTFYLFFEYWTLWTEVGNSVLYRFQSIFG